MGTFTNPKLAFGSLSKVRDNKGKINICIKNNSFKVLIFLRQRVGNQAGNYMFKINNRNTRSRCEISLELTVKKPERCQN